MHQLLERDVVALPERPPLRLAMVGEHDEVVRARRLKHGALQPLELRVEQVEHGEGIRLGDAGMVGDLVVADEGRVRDRHALDDVREQRRDVEVAHRHRDGGARERVDAAAGHVLLAALALAARRPPLQQHVPKEQRDGAGEAVRSGEVGEELV